MINSILEGNNNAGGQWFTYVILGVLIVAIIVMFVFSSRRRKKQEKDAQDLIDAVKPGNKVKTIGGICGIVVEVDSEENTFVLETGTETSGKCFLKFDRQAIYQTDAQVAGGEKKEEKAEVSENAEAAPVEEPFEEVKTQETAVPVETVSEESVKDEPVKEEPVKETAEVAAEKPAKKKSAKKDA